MAERSMDTTCATDPPHATDAELVRDARRGDTAAFEALTARHFPMVYALAYARLGAREAAEDLAQEVFLLATLHLGALADPARFAAWLGRIARNEAGMWRRRSQSASRLVRLVPLDDLPAEPAAPASQEARTALEADEETRALHEALFRLPEALREVVLLHYFEDLSKAEIAERLEVHPATVGRQIEKALKAMKRTLEPMLRRAAPTFRHSGKAAARTTLLVGAVAAMSAPAKAALLAEAGASVAILAAAAQTAAVSHTILTGGFIMSTKSQIVAVLVAIAIVAGVTYHQMAQPTTVPKAPAPASPPQAESIVSREQLCTILRYHNDLATNIEIHAVISEKDTAKGMHMETSCTLVIQGNKFRFEKCQYFPGTDKIQTSVQTYNGKTSAQYLKDTLSGNAYDGLGISRSNEVFIREISWYPFPHDYETPSDTGDMYPISSINRKIGPPGEEEWFTEILPDEDTVNGQACLKLKRVNQTIWLSKNQGYRPIKTSSVGSDVNDGFSWEVELMQVDGDFWFPRKGTRRQTFRDTERVVEVVDFEIYSIKINQALDENLFNASFPRGYHVYDHSVGTEYIVGGVDVAPTVNDDITANVGIAKPGSAITTSSLPTSGK